MQRIALLNIATGRCFGSIQVTSPEDLSAEERASEAFKAYSQSIGWGDDGVTLAGILDDGSAGTFITGPLAGAWIFLDHGQEARSESPEWVTDLVYRLQAEA